jgi:hypothetical protein
MSTEAKNDIKIGPPSAHVAVFGKLLATAIILTPLVVMAFPELNERSGAASRKSRPFVSAARSQHSPEADFTPAAVSND